MDRFFHRRGTERKEQKGGRRLLWGAVLALLLATLILYLGWSHRIQLARGLSDHVLGSSYFSVREIKVRGGEKVGGSEIVAMAGLSAGMNIWKVDPKAIEGKVAGHPWVKRVLVRREFPSRVVIEVEERIAKGILVLGKLYVVDSQGFVFKELGEGEKLDFPLLTGLQQADLQFEAQSTRQKIQEALKLSDLMGRSALGLSEVHFSASGGLVLYPMSTRVPVYMGWGDWQGKLERLERVLAVWRGREDRLVALDLSFRDQVVARLKKAEGLKG